MRSERKVKRQRIRERQWVAEGDTGRADRVA